MRLVLVPLALVGVLAAVGIASQDDGPADVVPQVELVEVGRFEAPVHVTAPRGDGRRVFVVEKKGRVWVLVDGRRLGRPFLDLSDRVGVAGFEEGLLSLAFAPDYETSGLFYVDYTDRRHRTVIEEYRRSASPNVADRASARRVLVIANQTPQHHGGLVLFGPDGYLYIGHGDGGGTTLVSRSRSPRVSSLHGKILRIDPRPSGGRSYGIPADNPYAAGAGRDEIWVSGLRNPWRFDIDPSGALVIGDVGQLSSEEIDVAPRAGLNFGWDCFEGTIPFAIGPDAGESCGETTPPALELVRGAKPVVARDRKEPTATRGRPRVDARLSTVEPVCSITSGVFVRDPGLPDLRGRHLFGDFCYPALRSFRLVDEQVVDVRDLGVDVPELTSFGVDGRDRVYAMSHDGAVFRLAAP